MATSTIDPTLPTAGTAYTKDVRDNFQAAKDDIEARPTLSEVQQSFLHGGEIWAPGLKTRGYLAVDNGYLAKAQVDTETRPAPQFSGDPYWVSGEGDTPAWVSQQVNEDVFAVGIQRTTPAGKTDFIERIRVWIPTVTDVEYAIYMERNGVGNVLVARSSFISTGWFVLNITDVIATAGTVTQVWLITYATANPETNWSGTWNQLNGTTDPASGECYFSGGAQDEIRFNNVDNNATDHSSDFANVPAGATLTRQGDGQVFTITDIAAQAYGELVTVSPAGQRGGTGLQTYQFTYPTSQNLDYVEIVNKFQSDADTKGLFDISGNGLPRTTTDNFVGVDLELHDADISDDWVILAITRL